MEMVFEARMLLRFLKEKSIYSRFRNNFFNQRHIRTVWVSENFFEGYSEYKCNDSLSKYATCVNAGGLINYAFRWCETKEGHDFWEKIDAEWKNYVREEKHNLTL